MFHVRNGISNRALHVRGPRQTVEFPARCWLLCVITVRQMNALVTPLPQHGAVGKWVQTIQGTVPELSKALTNSDSDEG